jgi:MFS family permease
VRLSFAVVARSIVFAGLSTFLALYVQQRLGGGSVAGTVALFVLYIGGGIGSVVGGVLAGRWDRVRVSRWSYLISVVAVAGVVFVPGPVMYLFVALTSMGLYVPFSLQVTLGQDYLPSRVGTASGITLGLTVSIGGTASPVIGWLADTTSLQIALAPLILMPVVSWLLFRSLPEPTVLRSAASTSAEGEGPHDALLSAPARQQLVGRRLRSFDTRLGRRDDDVDLLRRQPMFANLPVQTLDAVAAHLHPAEFEPGQTIMVEGGPSDWYVLVERGEVLIEACRRRGPTTGW